jgi:hypothetical protein
MTIARPPSASVQPAGRRRHALGPALIAGYVVLVTLGWSPFPPDIPANVQWSEFFFFLVFAYAVVAGDLVGWRPRSIDLLVGGYLVGALPSFLRSSDLGASALAGLKHLYLVVVYVVFSRLFVRRRNVATALGWLGLAAAGSAGIGVAAAIGYAALGVEVPDIGRPQPLPYLGPIFRLSGPAASAEMFANFLTVAAPAVLGHALAAEGRWRWWWWLAFGLVVAAAGLTFAHAVAGLPAALLVYLWPRWAHGRLRALRVGLVLLTAALVLALNAMVVVSVREVRLEHGTNSRLGPPPYMYGYQSEGQGPPMTVLSVSYNWMSYYLLKRVAWKTFWEAPLTGIGLGRFYDATERAYRDGELHVRYREIDPHSTLLGRLAETGIVGGATLVLMVAAFLWLGVRLHRDADPEAAWRARAVLAGIVGLLVSSVNVDIMNFRLLWLGFALLRGIAEAVGRDG